MNLKNELTKIIICLSLLGIIVVLPSDFSIYDYYNSFSMCETKSNSDFNSRLSLAQSTNLNFSWTLIGSDLPSNWELSATYESIHSYGNSSQQMWTNLDINRQVNLEVIEVEKEQGKTLTESGWEEAIGFYYSQSKMSPMELTEQFTIKSLVDNFLFFSSNWTDYADELAVVFNIERFGVYIHSIVMKSNQTSASQAWDCIQTLTEAQIAKLPVKPQPIKQASIIELLTDIIVIGVAVLPIAVVVGFKAKKRYAK